MHRVYNIHSRLLITDAYVHWVGLFNLAYLQLYNNILIPLSPI